MLKWIKEKVLNMMSVFNDNELEAEIERLRQEEADHMEAVKAISTTLSNPQGKKFIKYLLRSFNFGDFPAVGLRDNDLLEYTSFLRAGQSVYKMILEAAPELTGQLITEMEKERQDVLTKQKLKTESSN